MEILYADHSEHGNLRIIYHDRVISHPIGAHATMGTVAKLLRDLTPVHFGDPIAIDVRLPSHALPDFLPADFKFEDDPLAEFEDFLPARTGMNIPSHVALFKARCDALFS